LRRAAQDIPRRQPRSPPPLPNWSRKPTRWRKGRSSVRPSANSKQSRTTTGDFGPKGSKSGSNRSRPRRKRSSSSEPSRGASAALHGAALRPSGRPAAADARPAELDEQRPDPRSYHAKDIPEAAESGFAAGSGDTYFGRPIRVDGEREHSPITYRGLVRSVGCFYGVDRCPSQATVLGTKPYKTLLQNLQDP